MRISEKGFATLLCLVVPIKQSMKYESMAADICTKDYIPAHKSAA